MGTNHNNNNVFILRVDCPDRPGIVASVARCLEENGCNIEDATQFNDKYSGRFFMRVVFRPLREGDAVEKFANDFESIAQFHEMGWSLHFHKNKVRALILVSKQDHCLNDIVYRWRTGHLPIDITGVISNHDNNREQVEMWDIPFMHLPTTKDNPKKQERKIQKIFDDTKSELIVLARYMRILSDEFCERHQGRIINIHHSFLPGFKGANPYFQAWERGVKLIGATAHFVTPDLDEGPIIEQETARIDHVLSPRKMEILGKDIEASVLSRALLYYCEQRIFLHGRRTVIL